MRPVFSLRSIPEYATTNIYVMKIIPDSKKKEPVLMKSIVCRLFFRSWIVILLLLGQHVTSHGQVGQSVWHLLSNDCFLAQSFQDIVADSFITFTQLDMSFQKACTIDSLLDQIETINTFTAIENILQSIESKIAIIENEVDVDFNGTMTALIPVFDLTISIIDKLVPINSLTFEISTTVREIHDNVVAIQKGVEQLDLALHPETKADALLNEAITLNSLVDILAPCSEMPITQNATTIFSEGSYCLTQNVTGPVIIAASDVDLNMNNNFIIGGSQGIIITSGSKNVRIHNGAIDLVNNQGIWVQAAAEQITISNVRTSSCNAGIVLDGAKNCLINQCHSLFNNTGYMLENNALGNVIENCISMDDIFTAYELRNSHTNSILGCSAITTGSYGEQTSAGYLSLNGSHNVFDGCFVEGATTNGQQFEQFTAGFVLQGNETKSKIINSFANGISTSKFGFSTPFGILMLADLSLPNPITIADTKNVIPAADSVSWLPSSTHFIAVGGGSGSGNNVQIFSFDNGALNFITAANTGNTINSVSFSSSYESVLTGTLLIAGGVPANGFDVILYSFANPTLFVVDTYSHGSTVNSVAFDPFGNYAAVGGEIGFLGTEVEVLNVPLDGLIFVAASASVGSTVTHVAWSALGEILTVADITNTISFFKFDGVSLTFLTSVSRSAPIYSLSWSPYAELLAVGGAATGGHTIELYEFEETTATLVATGGPTIEVRSLEWVQARSNVLATIQLNNGGAASLFAYDGSSINLISTQPARGKALSWSYDGQHLATITETGALRVFDVDFALPSKCLIRNNLLSSIAGGLTAYGIEGYGHDNAIIENICYETDFPFTYGISNRYVDGLDGFIKALDNVGIPPYSSLDPAEQLILNIQNPQFRALPGANNPANFLVEQTTSFFLNIRKEKQGLLNMVEVMEGIKPPNPIGREGRKSERLEIDINGNLVSLRAQEQARGADGQRIGRQGRRGRRGRR